MTTKLEIWAWRGLFVFAWFILLCRILPLYEAMAGPDNEPLESLTPQDKQELQDLLDDLN